MKLGARLKQKLKQVEARAGIARRRADAQKRALIWRKHRTEALKGGVDPDASGGVPLGLAGPIARSVKLEIASRRKYHQLLELSRLLTKRGRLTRKKLKILRKKQEEARNTKTIGTFDGKPVPRWMIPWLEKSRRAGWRGVVVSGVRTTAHSIELCHQMCGAPSCPGRCAGASSNHNADEPIEDGEGAVDCTDFLNLAAILRRMGAPLKNDLPLDRPHFSRSGH